MVVWWLVLTRGVSAVFGAEYTHGLHILRALGATLVTVPLIYAARRWLDRRPWSGLEWTSFARGWRQFLFGAACWAVPAGVTAAVLLGLGWADIDPRTSLPRTLLALAGLVVLVLLFEAIPEELIFRGYFFANLRERYSVAVTVVSQAALFTAWGVLHGSATTIDRIALFFVFALVLGGLRAKTGSLWTSIGFHAAFQVTSQFLVTNHWNNIALHDPDLAIGGLAFVVAPFLVTAAVLLAAQGIRGWSRS
ncbi:MULTISPECIES: CPBP family intramembrane glutamic endopeptidase [unclassified Nocardia]|uniref:CPBP family intramembrane glutamic endopeptidase n=1 Tax=unclassified Nocardia TaxID=2637762 RepID=UPI001CE3E81B|nr:MULTISPECIES: CPBP family intramembrane glutamic endopeptidase [unclassified Nocardia]